MLVTFPLKCRSRRVSENESSGKEILSPQALTALVPLDLRSVRLSRQYSVTGEIKAYPSLYKITGMILTVWSIILT